MTGKTRFTSHPSDRRGNIFIGSNRATGWQSKLMLVVAECSGVCAATSLPSAGATQAEWRGLRQATGRPSAPTAWPGIANLFG